MNCSGVHIAGMVAAFAALAAAPAYSTHRSQDRADLAFIQRTLREEAKASQSHGRLQRSSPNLADLMGSAAAPPAQQVVSRLTRRADSNAFIDAYMRWQMTALPGAAEISTISDRDFDALLNSLPAMIANPRADAALLESLQQAAARGALNEQQQDEVNRRLNALADLVSRSRAMNVPAVEFRRWLTGQFAAQPHRVLALLLETAHASVLAGWPAEEQKVAIDDLVRKAARQREFTAAQRRAFVQAAERAMTSARMFLVDAGVSEGALYVNFATTGIFDYDVRRWARILADEQ